MIGFVLWSIFGGLFICLGIYAFFAKKPIGFWANAKAPNVTDRRRYNRAMAKLFCVYGVGFLLLGFPLLAGQNTAWPLFSVAGVMAESIAAMIAYTLVIEKKYRESGHGA